ncbi:DUF4166 domain-containing protein [Longispora sp. NPDC051575]|uniref:DUF4166 domain-containing protein n=1 Tax=Longispora sp. NPDC051575 TaxID=3154943 RepID=UPI0034336106
MTSIFQQALGADFDRLHPQLRRRFGFSSADGLACTGTGTMDRVWRGGGFTRPFLALGARRHILVPAEGRDVPFTIRNCAYRDSLGRETVTFARTFWLGGPRHWDATMVYSPERGVVVDYLGTHQHLAVDLRLSVDDRGGLVIRSGEQRLHEGALHCRIPALLTGAAEVRESYDEELGGFRIRVSVTNRRFGPLFGYHGTFTATYTEGDPVPATVRPLRETASA